MNATQLFSRQELLYEYTMSSARSLLIFDFPICAADFLGVGGGDQTLKESRHIWATCVCQDSSHCICWPACPVKTVLFWTPTCVAGDRFLASESTSAATVADRVFGFKMTYETGSEYLHPARDHVLAPPGRCGSPLCT